MNFTPSEWIGIAQAIILLFTAVVIGLYTLETARIRKQTSIQNTLLAEQLRLMQANAQRELDKEASFIKPFFKFGGGKHSTDHASVKFENKGGPAYKLAARPIDPFWVTVNPTRILDSNGQGSFEIKAPDFSQKDKWGFELSYTDKLGKQYVSRLSYKPYTGVSDEES